MTSVHFSSQSDDWATPQDLFDRLNEDWGPFNLDVCASAHNRKCKQYFSVSDNGLKQVWAPNRCWMNPPYGRTIGKWIEKAYKESMDGALVVCLIPSRTDTAWWHDYVMRGKVIFIRGRIKFNNHVNSAPFPSAIVIFRGKHEHETISQTDFRSP